MNEKELINGIEITKNKDSNTHNICINTTKYIIALLNINSFINFGVFRYLDKFIVSNPRIVITDAFSNNWLHYQLVVDIDTPDGASDKILFSCIRSKDDPLKYTSVPNLGYNKEVISKAVEMLNPPALQFHYQKESTISERDVDTEIENPILTANLSTSAIGRVHYKVVERCADYAIYGLALLSKTERRYKVWFYKIMTSNNEIIFLDMCTGPYFTLSGLSRDLPFVTIVDEYNKHSEFNRRVKIYDRYESVNLNNLPPNMLKSFVKQIVPKVVRKAIKSIRNTHYGKPQN